METVDGNSTYKLKTCEMHTCGEPVRILETTEPAVKFPENSNISEKKKYFSEKFDFIRQMLMLEPRGHKDMFGVILTDPNENSGSDYGVLFLNIKEYAPMCGHATIAIGRYLLERKLVKPVVPETTIKLDCICGLVVIYVEWDGTSVGKTKFFSVPAFVERFDYETFVPQLDLTVKYDIAFGGNFYAIISMEQLGINFENDSKKEIVEKGIKLMKFLKNSVKISSAVSEDIAFLYGVLITDSDDHSNIIDNLCIFGDESVDRSPCGSGTTAIVANLYFKKNIKLTDEIIVRNPFLGQHSTFTGIPINENLIKTKAKEIKAITVQVSGRSYFVGESHFTYEENDVFKFGFNF